MKLWQKRITSLSIYLWGQNPSSFSSSHGQVVRAFLKTCSKRETSECSDSRRDEIEVRLCKDDDAAHLDPVSSVDLHLTFVVDPGTWNMTTRSGSTSLSRMPFSRYCGLRPGRFTDSPLLHSLMKLFSLDHVL